MKKTICIMIAVIIVSLNFNISFCDDIDLNENLTAVIIGEYDSGEILHEYNSDHEIEIASITKLMTYLVVMDKITSKSISLEDIVEIGLNPTIVGGSTFKLGKGEKIQLKTLIEAAIIASGNDACVAIAEHISGNEEEFIKLMNEKAQQLGLKSAIFYNSSGMPITTKENIKIQNKMNVIDIFNLSRHIVKKYPQILSLTNREDIDVPERDYYKENTNPLLKEIPLVDGLKTGYTDKAGYCLIATLEIPKGDDNDESFRIISIAMGAKSEEERKERNKKVVNYVMNNYKKQQVLSKDISISKLEILDAVNPDTDIFPKDDVFKLIKLGESVTTKVELNKEIIAPISKGEKVGRILINHNDKIQEVDLIVIRDIEKAGFFKRLFRSIQNFILKISIADLFRK